MNNIYYFGRNIKHDDTGYYLVYQKHQSVQNSSKNYSRTFSLKTWDEARNYLSKLIEVGHTWLPVHQDPTL